MTMVLRLGKCCLRPFPLACILHVVLLMAVAALGGFMVRPAAQPEAEVVMELTSEEAAVREAIAPAARSWTNRLVPPAQTTTQDAAVDAASEREAAAAGAGAEETLLSATETAAGHDVAAAGSGSQDMASDTGDGEIGGAAGSSDGSAGAADTGAAGGQAAETGNASEAVGSIAARFAVRVEQRKEYPYMAVKRGLTGVVTVGVMLGSDGSLQAADIAASSGSPLLDESALTAVRRACPFPHGAGRSVSLQVPIVYELE